MKLKPSVLWAAALFAAALSPLKSEAQTCKAPQPTICNRSCWLARSPQCTITTDASLTRAIIHHTAASSDYTTDYEVGKSKVRGVQNYHMDVNGWCDIGYHFLVNAGGDIYEGRYGSMTQITHGAHDGCNSSSFGFNVMGYYHSPYNQTFTAASKTSLQNAIGWRMPTGWSASGSGTYCGNTVGTVDGHYKVLATACPGDIIIAQIPSIRTGVASARSCGVTKIAVIKDNPSGVPTGSWVTGTSSTDKYGTDYRYHATAAVSEPFTWTGNLNVGGSWNVRAWWPEGGNRSLTAPYIVYHGATSTTVPKNQQTSGGVWNLLGTWSDFASGNNDVALSVWTTTGFNVMADAVKWD